MHHLFAAGGGACDLKNLVIITAVSAKNLPNQWGDKIDPYVKFWVDNDENKAKTTSFQNKDNPVFHWQCPFAYSGVLNFDGGVYDDDVGVDDKVGDFASSGRINIDEAFLEKHDPDGDGEFDYYVYLFKNGEKVSGEGGLESTVHFKFQLIKAPGYKTIKS